jgi:hypothetical protein
MGRPLTTSERWRANCANSLTLWRTSKGNSVGYRRKARPDFPNWNLVFFLSGTRLDWPCLKVKRTGFSRDRTPQIAGVHNSPDDSALT